MLKSETSIFSIGRIVCDRKFPLSKDQLRSSEISFSSPECHNPWVVIGRSQCMHGVSVE